VCMCVNKFEAMQEHTTKEEQENLIFRARKF